MEMKDPQDSPVQSHDSGDEEVQHALDRLSQHALEHGLYDGNEMPKGGSDE
jgi:hypothetical protein